MTTATTLDRIRRDRAGESHYATLQDLAGELVRLQATKRDDVVDTRRMSFATTEGESFLTFDSSDPRDDGTAGGPVNDYAHGQLADHLDVPKRYYDRLRVQAPGLLDQNVLHWLHNPVRRDGKPAPATRMVRMLDGRVRALLSNSFRRLDNFDLMERSILPALQDVDGLTFQVGALTPERMTIRALLPSLEREIRTGDVVQAGVQIRNSEVGAGKLEVAPFVWRLVCLNGMVLPAQGLSAIHLGARVTDDEATRRIFARDTLRADDVAFFLKARDAVKAAITETQFELIVDQLRAATTGETIDQPVEATRSLTATFDLTEEEGGSILAQLASGGDLSRWGMANAVTAAAKQADSFDRQHDLESLGWKVATMPAGDWQRIAVAA